jgi:hypothetical protein
MVIEAIRVMAITEDENEISLRDANHSRERPTLEGFDMDEDVVSEIEVFQYHLKLTIMIGT